MCRCHHLWKELDEPRTMDDIGRLVRMDRQLLDAFAFAFACAGRNGPTIRVTCKREIGRSDATKKTMASLRSSYAGLIGVTAVL